MKRGVVVVDGGHVRRGVVAVEGAPARTVCALGQGAVWSRETLLDFVSKRLDLEARLRDDGRLEVWADVDERGNRIRRARPEGAVPKHIRVVNLHSEGRTVAVLLPDGTIQRGSEVDERYEVRKGTIEWRGIEVRSDTVNGSGEPIIDERGYPCWQPSDMGSGGETLHRLSGPDARWRIRVVMDDGTEQVHLFRPDVPNKSVALVIYGRVSL